MRAPLAISLLTITLGGCAVDGDDNGGPTPFDEDPPLSGEGETKGDAPTDLPDEGKADAVYPKQWNEIENEQSPVKSQGSRGVCSIFASTAQVENLYIHAGMANPDFSEQYMQWSVKNQVGDYRNTEGSNGDSNLESVVEFGTVLESVWPYESAPWTAANDAECTGGENLPTKCYTNGEPPAAAAGAQKYRLPSKRWMSSSQASIKNHLTTKKTGVVVGMTFFYQSWNHRRSELPVSTDYWQKGYVTYPNADDKTKSLAKRAGHAILIIGWDDELEVPMRDKDGNPVLDGNGNPMVEKGFWLFKNSWGTVGFGINHQNGPGYGWLSYKYVAEYGNAVVAEKPTLEQPREACDVAGDEDSDGQADCADADCTAHPACAAQPTEHTYTASPNLSIPDNDPAGVSSDISVADAATVGTVEVTLDITHTYRGDLTVTLTKGQVTRTVVAEQGGAEDNIVAAFDVTGFAGQALAGTWTLKVVDGAGQDVGTLNSWTLSVGGNN